jgi:hypothetical protein
LTGYAAASVSETPLLQKFPHREQGAELVDDRAVAWHHSKLPVLATEAAVLDP